MDHYKIPSKAEWPREETVEISQTRDREASDAVREALRTKTVTPRKDLDLFVRCRRRDPFRAVDWRWRLAMGWLRSQDRWLPKTPQDRTLRALCRYLKRKAQGLPPLKWDFTLEHAEALWQGSEPRQRALLQAWLLCCTDHVEIAKKVSLPEKVVDLYALAFFDVRKRSSIPRFVVHQVLRLHTLNIETFAEAESVTWQLDAAFYGRDGLKQLIAISELMRDPTVPLTGIDTETSEQLFRYHRYVLDTALPVWSSLSPKHALQEHIRSRREELKRRRRMRREGQHSPPTPTPGARGQVMYRFWQ